MLSENSVNEFTEKVASSAPTPGGGSVSALSGALGTALGLMVCRLTVGKKKYSDVEAEITNIQKELECILKRFIQLIDEDSNAYNMVVEARKGNGKIQEALIFATKIPHEVAWHAYRALIHFRVLAEKGNVNAISDVCVGAHMLKSAINGGIVNAQINLTSIDDETFIEKTTAELGEMVREGEKIFNEIIAVIKPRLVIK